MNLRNQNILIDELPEYLTVEGVEYPINTSFRIGIMFSQLLEEIADPLQFRANAINLFFDTQYFNELFNSETVMEQIIWFFNCGFKEDEQKIKYIKEHDIVIEKPDKHYDYDYDADSIYASFMYDYKIDLQDIDTMHWWKFNALLRGLSDDTRFKKILHIRTYDMTDLSNKAKMRIQKIQRQEPYAIPRKIDDYDMGKAEG